MVGGWVNDKVAASLNKRPWRLPARLGTLPKSRGSGKKGAISHGLINCNGRHRKGRQETSQRRSCQASEILGEKPQIMSLGPLFARVVDGAGVWGGRSTPENEGLELGMEQVRIKDKERDVPLVRRKPYPRADRNGRKNGSDVGERIGGGGKKCPSQRWVQVVGAPRGKGGAYRKKRNW